MRFIQHVLAALSLCFIAAAASATPTSPVSGTDFRTLEKPQPAEPGKKVEVIEFFWYSCPHCNAFEPMLEDWVKKQGDNIVFKRVPVAFAEQMGPEQRLFYSLEAMGKSEEFQRKIFNAIHVEHQRLNTEVPITEFIAKNGIDKAKFSDLYNSFSVQTKVKRAVQMQEAYKVDGVPLIVVDGRYETSPSMVNVSLGGVAEPALHAGTLQVMDWLVDKAGKERKTQGAATKIAPPHATLDKKAVAK